jgi:hypothetical protein
LLLQPARRSSSLLVLVLEAMHMPAQSKPQPQDVLLLSLKSTLSRDKNSGRDIYGDKTAGRLSINVLLVGKNG